MLFRFFLRFAIFKKNQLDLKIGPRGPTDYLRINVNSDNCDSKIRIIGSDANELGVDDGTFVKQFETHNNKPVWRNDLQRKSDNKQWFTIIEGLLI